MKHARQRKEKENTEAQTERCDTARLKRRARAIRKCYTDGAKTDRYTDRQTRRGIRWVVVSHGERGVSSSGQRHYSNRRYTFFPIIQYCGCFGALCLSDFHSF